MDLDGGEDLVEDIPPSHNNLNPKILGIDLMGDNSNPKGVSEQSDAEHMQSAINNSTLIGGSSGGSNPD